MKRYDPARDHDPLPLTYPTPLRFAMRNTTRTATKPKPTPSSKHGACPGHSLAGKLTGLVRQGDHLVWRVHTRALGSGQALECPASGVPVCQMPARATAQHAAVWCPCGSHQ